MDSSSLGNLGRIGCRGLVCNHLGSLLMAFAKNIGYATSLEAEASTFFIDLEIEAIEELRGPREYQVTRVDLYAYLLGINSAELLKGQAVELVEQTVEEPVEQAAGTENDIGESEEQWNEPVACDQDEIGRPYSDDEDEISRPVYLVFNLEIEFSKVDFQLKVGQRFRNINAFREALVEWHVREGYMFKFIKNEGRRVSVTWKMVAHGEYMEVQSSMRQHFKSRH
ncbi:hypothetical protein ACH5RR_015437 [Cinchona calisaya]|uniref:Transposase MuDR plant domain-containing protein n=1 Tax=Cinchona calisaya TaxID=153742 RepID=A0ABD2ZYJ0_9GENT